MSTMSSFLDAASRDQLSRDVAEYPPRRLVETGASLVQRGLKVSAANDEDRAAVRALAAGLLADAERKPWLRYVQMDAPHLGAVLVGCDYTPADGGMVTSASTEPPQREDITVEEVWLRGVEISNALSTAVYAWIVYDAMLKARAGAWA